MVKPGYKQTEIGIIPEDWECAMLLDKSKLLNGLTYTPDNVKDHGLFVLRSSNIQNNQLSFEDTLYVDCIVDDEKKIKDGDILICVRNGSAALIGKSAQAHRDYNATFGAFMAVLRGEHNDYIQQVLQQGIIQREISKNSGATINQITNGDFKQIRIALPTSRDEEVAITTTLSHVDRLISTIEKLIAKKKAIKQGAMQELLTGKKRLPGFSGAWNEVRLEDICSKITDGSHESPPESDIGYYMPSVKDMTDLGFDYSECKRVSFKDFKKLEQNGCRPDIGDVLIAKDGSILKYAFVQENDEKIVILSSIAIVKPYPSRVNSHFLAQHFRQPDFVNRVITNYKSGTGVPRIVLKGFKEITLFIPESISEQASIAKVLVDMDKEIFNLEMKLAKYRQVKQGMMQQLLTGKIRLVD